MSFLVDFAAVATGLAVLFAGCHALDTITDIEERATAEIRRTSTRPDARRQRGSCQSPRPELHDPRSFAHDSTLCARGGSESVGGTSRRESYTCQCPAPVPTSLGDCARCFRLVAS